MQKIVDYSILSKTLEYSNIDNNISFIIIAGKNRIEHLKTIFKLHYSSITTMLEPARAKKNEVKKAKEEKAAKDNERAEKERAEKARAEKATELAPAAKEVPTANDEKPTDSVSQNGNVRRQSIHAAFEGRDQGQDEEQEPYPLQINLQRNLQKYYS